MRHVSAPHMTQYMRKMVNRLHSFTMKILGHALAMPMPAVVMPSFAGGLHVIRHWGSIWLPVFNQSKAIFPAPLAR